MSKKLLHHKEQRVVVVAGGLGYLGGCIVNRLAKEGITVAVISRKTMNSSNNSTENKIYFFEADLTDSEAMFNIAAKIKNTFGSIFGVIQAASAPLSRQGLLGDGNFDFDQQFSVNVLGSFNLFKSLQPLISKNGSIIAITSKAIESGVNFGSTGFYVPAKQALRSLLRVLSKELLGRLVRVYAVAPAFMPGGLNADLPFKVTEFIQAKSREEDITSPELVAQVVVKLIMDESGSFSGKSIAVPTQEVSPL